jgi:hypothetical protein
MKNKQILKLQGSLWASYNGLTAVFLIAYALALGASNTVIGLLGALPWLASLIAQIPGYSA